MRLVKASYEIYAASFNKDLPYSYDNSELLIEIAGRTCFKSEKKITEGTAEKFVNMLKSRKHYAMIEHSWNLRYYTEFCPHYKFLNFMPMNTGILVAGNDRAFNEWEYEHKNEYIKPTMDMIKEIYNQKCWNMLSATVKIITDRGISHEIVRHRPSSYAQESTRYCNYCNSKFNNHISFIIPPWLDLPEGEWTWNNINKSDILAKNLVAQYWVKSMLDSEQTYNNLISEGWNPERARSVLPNSLKTEIVITADLAEWQHIFKLRIASDAHEQIREIMIPLREDFKKLFPEIFI